MNRARPEWVFAALALPFGLFFALAHPPLDPPDEIRHLARTYLITKGQLLPPGRAPGHDGQIPRSLFALHPLREGISLDPHHARGGDAHSPARLRANLGRPLAPEDTQRMLRTSFVSPAAYAYAWVGVGAARALELPAGWMLYLGRLTSLLGYVAACWFAIRWTPVRKWAFVLVAATPMTIYSASSISSDPVTHSVAFLFAAQVLRLAFGEDARATPRAIGALLLTCAVLGATKTGYATLAGLVLLIPADRFASTARRWQTIAAAGALAAATTLGWAALVQLVDGVGAEDFADPVAQARFILGNPLTYAGVLLTSVLLQIVAFVAGFVGVLGQLDIVLPGVFYVLVPLGIVVACLADDFEPASLDRERRLGALALFALCAIGLMTLGYIGWNPVGAPLIVGMQGRYFAPLAPLLLIALPGRRIGAARAPQAIAATLGLAGLALLAAAIATWQHDYV